MAADKTKRLFPMPISRVTFGMRFEPQWKVFDYAGGILDTILRSDGTPFGPDVFSQTNTGLNERMLLSPEKQHILRLNQQDAILIWNVDTRSLDEVVTLARQFDEFVLTPLRIDVGLGMIYRYGMVLGLKQMTGVKNPPLNRYLAHDFTESSLTTLAMRFSRRLPALEAMWRKNVEDYRQVIYQVEESEKGEVQIAVDYQEYFKPLLDSSDWAKHSFTTFAEQGGVYFEQEASKWLKSFTEAPAAVA